MCIVFEQHESAEGVQQDGLCLCRFICRCVYIAAGRFCSERGIDRDICMLDRDVTVDYN